MQAEGAGFLPNAWTLQDLGDLLNCLFENICRCHINLQVWLSGGGELEFPVSLFMAYFGDNDANGNT